MWFLGPQQPSLIHSISMTVYLITWAALKDLGFELNFPPSDQHPRGPFEPHRMTFFLNVTSLSSISMFQTRLLLWSQRTRWKKKWGRQGSQWEMAWRHGQKWNDWISVQAKPTVMDNHSRTYSKNSNKMYKLIWCNIPQLSTKLSNET